MDPENGQSTPFWTSCERQKRGNFFAETVVIECGQPCAPANRWPGAMTSSKHVYELRPRKDKRGVDLIFDVLPFGRLWYGEPNAISNAIGYAKFLQPFT